MEIAKDQLCKLDTDLQTTQDMLDSARNKITTLKSTGILREATPSSTASNKKSSKLLDPEPLTDIKDPDLEDWLSEM